MIKRSILGLLLHLANRDVQPLYKEKFYAVKKKILLRFGTMLGEEIQHFRKECWSCDSTGKYKCDWKPTESCWSCAGTGIYEEYWVRLDKYKLGSYTFHNPTKRQYSYEPLFEGKSLQVISGCIRHRTPKYNLGAEALLWLFLFYDYATFKKLAGCLEPCGKVRTPIILLLAIAFWFKYDLKYTIEQALEKLNKHLRINTKTNVNNNQAVHGEIPDDLPF